MDICSAAPPGVSSCVIKPKLLPHATALRAKDRRGEGAITPPLGAAPDVKPVKRRTVGRLQGYRHRFAATVLPIGPTNARRPVAALVCACVLPGEAPPMVPDCVGKVYFNA